MPHIILLHIGTNDANEFTADVIEADLNTLLDELVAGAPDALIVLAKIIPLGWNNPAARRGSVGNGFGGTDHRH